MKLDQASALKNKISAHVDEEMAAHADDTARGVMTFICRRCKSPNAYWRSKCLVCYEPADSKYTPTEVSILDVLKSLPLDEHKSPCHPDNGGITGVKGRGKTGRGCPNGDGPCFCTGACTGTFDNATYGPGWPD